MARGRICASIVEVISFSSGCEKYVWKLLGLMITLKRVVFFFLIRTIIIRSASRSILLNEALD